MYCHLIGLINCPHPQVNLSGCALCSPRPMYGNHLRKTRHRGLPGGGGGGRGIWLRGVTLPQRRRSKFGWGGVPPPHTQKMKTAISFLQQLAKRFFLSEMYRNSVHGRAFGLKSYLAVA